MTTANEQQVLNNFANAKAQCLGKRDKSSAGRIDPHAVDICGILNSLSAYFTTSSCAGRCFLYTGPGVKATADFKRYRVSHERIDGDPVRYFDLSTLESDPTGGSGDPVRTVGQYDYKMQGVDDEADSRTPEQSKTLNEMTERMDGSIWLRFEPFILHVACRSLESASILMNTARPAFKNVGLTTWKKERYLVAIWGDEGLDMPLSTPDGQTMVGSALSPEWLAGLVNERHERNWAKIERFVQLARDIPNIDDFLDEETNETKIPRAYDVIGDIALFHSMEATGSEERRKIGQALMKRNKGIKVVAVRESNLTGINRSTGQDGISVIAGPNREPLMTGHSEYGIKCIVDLKQTFFSPRMGPERLRICQQVARGEQVLVLFAGVAMDALQIAGRTEATSVTAVELNEIAVMCAKRSHQTLARNKNTKCPGAAERLEIVHGDVLDVLPTLPRNYYDRILAPRPKEGALDGDLGSGDGGVDFLRALLPVLKTFGGECHWYDFVADHEFPECSRTRSFLERVIRERGLSFEVLHTARVGSVAMRQLRVCIDFRINSLCNDR